MSSVTARIVVLIFLAVVFAVSATATVVVVDNVGKSGTDCEHCSSSSSSKVEATGGTESSATSATTTTTDCEYQPEIYVEQHARKDQQHQQQSPCQESMSPVFRKLVFDPDFYCKFHAVGYLQSQGLFRIGVEKLEGCGSDADALCPIYSTLDPAHVMMSTSPSTSASTSSSAAEETRRKRAEMSLAINRAIQLCFYLVTGFDRPDCLVSYSDMEPVSRKEVVYTYSSFPPMDSTSSSSSSSSAKSGFQLQTNNNNDSSGSVVAYVANASTRAFDRALGWIEARVASLLYWIKSVRHA